MTISKYQLLTEFVESCKHLPAQGSAAWKASRLKFIGGSEVATLIKVNKYNTINKLIMGKLGFDPFAGSVVTHWGNVFEELIRSYCERQFNCIILETGSIKYPDGYLAYSPDGLSVVPSSALKTQFGNLLSSLNVDGMDRSYLTLFEFKCPHSRIPTIEVPDHYLPQVKVGMQVIDFLEVAIFAQAVFRRCSLSDLRYNSEHNNQGHYKEACPRGNPLEYGFIAMFARDADTYSQMTMMLECVGCPTAFGTYDFGRLSDSDAFEELLGNCVNKSIGVDYSFRGSYDPQIFDSHSYERGMYDISLQRQTKLATTKMVQRHELLLGVLPYKLMDVFITPVPKSPTYISDNNILTIAKKVIDFIGNNATASKDELKRILRKTKF